jgi:hypothetical protein
LDIRHHRPYASGARYVKTVQGIFPFRNNMDPPSLDHLKRACVHCLQTSRHDAGAPCRELLRRAFCDHNDAAWDAVIVHLWPTILGWLYEQQPDLSPAAAERLGYQAVRQFHSHHSANSDLATPFPTFQLLMADLRDCTRQVVACALASSASNR